MKMKIKMKIISGVDGREHLYWDNRKYLGYAYRGVDGFYCFVFHNYGGCGSMDAYVLRAIADVLDELNEDIGGREQINDDPTVNGTCRLCKQQSDPGVHYTCDMQLHPDCNWHVDIDPY